MSSSPSHPRTPIESSFLDRSAEEELDVDRVLRALAHRRRREVLGLLDEQPSVTRAELVDRMIDLGNGPGATSMEEVETALVHRHLPKLEQADLVAIDADTWLVKRGEQYDTVRAMADAAATVDVEH